MNSKIWDELVGYNESAKIYHLYKWGSLLNEIHGYKLFYLEENDGIFPLALVNSYIFGDRLISLPFTDYGGPCARKRETIWLLLMKAEGIAQELGIKFMEIRCPDENYFEIFENAGFVKREDYFTYILALNKGMDELWKGIGDKNRNMVRKAERNNVEIKMATDKSDIREFYRLYLKTMKKLGSPPQPTKYFNKMWDLFYPENMMIPMAIYNDKCIASGIYFTYRGIIHHAYSCSLREYLRLAPNDFIQWQVIKWGNEHGFKQLDFGRTRENAGNVLFKRRWGGALTNMPYFYKFYKGKLEERQEIKYKKLSRIWSKCMPNIIAERLGPWLMRQIG